MATAGMCSVFFFSIRTNYHFLGVQMLNPVSRGVAYSISMSVTNSNSNKDFSARGNRGPLNRRPKREAGEPRSEKMALDQDWTSIYPTAAPFKQATVPLPVRMGYPVERGVPPEKKGNLELIKIPNFLHLTPAAIKKHCEALKPFCTEWPSALDSDSRCEEHFPIQLESKDYVSAGTSLRNPKARVVTLTVKLSSLNLDEHARKKLIKLAGERYCQETDTLTITGDRCPLRKQNSDYAMYLLTVLYHESWKTEAWEQEKTAADMEEYSWEGSPSQRSALDTLLRMQGPAAATSPQELLGSAEVQAYRESVTRLKNEGDSESGLQQYREAVRRMFSL